VMAHINHVLYTHGLRNLHVARVRRNLGRPRERNVTIGVLVVVAGYLKNHDYKEALKLGSACGGATAFSEDLAQLDLIKEVEKQLTVEKIS
ncbi:MAG TPA: hypothetical protein H9980_11330, partial [Candidatus Erysipelatoclostridium merdavium]|nr:hypothetical protein [Candidatus Erysipelatoclostridium merdavium]